MFYIWLVMLALFARACYVSTTIPRSEYDKAP